ncbi:hypothetical protein [Antrihabitans sp. YC2-6]|uniref:hypothetical protein n=1 Tax=Antrihabitans sp. YC2-6 TaxID=2799498 RepID=UPI001F211C3F|nr:hypothetical protein [Antrihabitans sp. YC2-6]
MPIDPTADFGRRAWLPCPACAHNVGCGDCGSGKNCDNHWQYLLSNKGPQVFLQCSDCAHLWAFDSRDRTYLAPKVCLG